MADILELAISELLKNDKDKLYRNALSFLASKHSKLKKWKTASKVANVDQQVLEVTKLIVSVALQADAMLKQASFEKEAGFIWSIMMKTLRITQKILAGLLVMSPWKVGVAYNALYNVIKILDKNKLKKKI